MKRILLAFLLSVILIGCSTDNKVAEPKPQTKSQDFGNFDDDRLCELSFTRTDPRIDKEISKRSLYCDQADFSCRKQGVQRNSLAMVECLYNEKLKNQSPNVKACFDSGISKDDINGMTNCLIDKERTHNVENHQIILYDYKIVKDK